MSDKHAAGQAFAETIARQPKFIRDLQHAALRLRTFAAGLEHIKQYLNPGIQADIAADQQLAELRAAMERDKRRWRDEYGIAYPETVEDYRRLAVAAGVTGETALTGDWTFADLQPIIEGYLIRRNAEAATRTIRVIHNRPAFESDRRLIVQRVVRGNEETHYVSHPTDEEPHQVMGLHYKLPDGANVSESFDETGAVADGIIDPKPMYLPRDKPEVKAAGNATGARGRASIPPEHRSKPMTLTAAAKKLGYSTSRKTNDAGRQQVQRDIVSGALHVQRVSATGKKYWFDVRDDSRLA
jgi:hypothetical protein